MPSKKPLVLGLNGFEQLQSGDYIDIPQGGTGAVTAAGARTALGLEIGTNVQQQNSQLSALAGMVSTGAMVRLGVDSYTTRTMTAPAAGFTINNPDGVVGNPTFLLSDDLAAIEAMSTTGIVVRTGTSTWTSRTLQGTAGRTTVTNASGVAGDPVIDLATLSDGGGGALLKFTRDAYGRVSGTSSPVLSDITSILGTTYVPTAGGTMTGALILNADPVSAMGAATKQFVEALALAGQRDKPSVEALAIANVNIAAPGTSTFDGVVLSNGQRLLLVGQSTTSQNGPWIFNGTAVALTRPTDFDTSAKVLVGSTFFVSNGTVYDNSNWTLINPGPYTLGTTGLTFTQTNGLGQVTAGSGLLKSGSTLNVDLAARLTFNGNAIDLANSGVTPGTYTKITVDTYGRATVGATATAADVGAQASNADLTALAALATTGLTARTGSGTYASRSITAPAAGITVTNGNGVAGNPTLVLANDLSALEALASTGFAARTAADTWAQRTMTGTAGRVTVANGDGVSGNPTIDLATVTTGTTVGGLTFDNYGRVTNYTPPAGSGGNNVKTALTNSEGTTTAICSAVYSDVTGGFRKANANAIGTSLVTGLLAASINAAASGDIVTSGDVDGTTGQWDAVTGQTGGLTINTVYYLDNVTAGRITTTQPASGFVVPVGKAASTTKLIVNIGMRVQL